MFNNNKSIWIDDIVNERLKVSKNILMPICIKRFNIIFDSGIFPKIWSSGINQPIQKKKGSFAKSKNYRPVSLLFA